MMKRNMTKRNFYMAVVLVSFLGFASERAHSQMAQARLWSVFPSGCQAGKEAEVRLSGVDLDGAQASSLIFSHPGIKGAPVSAGLFRVAVGADVPPGIYEVSAAGTFGVSNPRCFVVGSSQEVAEEQGKNNTYATATEIPQDCSVSGVVQGVGSRDFYRFKASKGSRVVVDCFSTRIDSQLLPVLTAYNSAGIEIVSSRVDKRRDALLDFKVADDGPVTLEVRDIRYKGSNDYFYRLRVSTGPHVDTILPPVGVPGTEQEFLILGRNLPGGQPAPEYSFNGIVPEKLVRKVRIPELTGEGGDVLESRDYGGRRFPQALQKDLGSAEGAYLWLATHPVSVETEPNNEPGKANIIKGPCEIAGRVYPRGDRDLFEFVAAEDGKWKIEIRSQRLGLGTDPAFSIQQVTTDKDGKETVKELKYQDDGLPNIGGGHFSTVSDDPAGEFDAKKGQKYRIRVRDLYSDGRADPRNVYTLVLSRAQPDFNVVLLPGYPESDTDAKKNKPGVWGSLLRRNGTTRFIAYLHRKDGFNGPVELTFEGLPESVKSANGQIYAGKNSTMLVLHAAADAPDWAGAFRVYATARIGEKDVRKEVSYGTLLWSGASVARLTGGLGLGVSGAESSPFKLESAAAVNDMARGGTLELALKVPREGWAQGKITVNALGLPGGVELKQFNVNDKQTEAKVKVVVKPNAALGDHVFYLRGNTEVQYRRNPRAADAAKKRQEELDGVVKSTAGELAAKDKSLAESTAALAKAREAVKKTTAELAAAKKAAEMAAKSAESLAGKAKAAANAAEKTPADTNLVSARAEAEKAHQAALKKSEEASGKLPAVEKKQADAVAAVTAAEGVKKKAEEEAKLAKEKAAKAKTDLEAAKKTAAGLANASKPKKTKVGIYSYPIKLKITDAAFAFDGKPGTEGVFKIKAGSSADLPLKIKRLYGFKEQVNIKVAGAMVKGVKIAAAQVPKDKVDSSFKIEVAADAPVGKHEVQVEAGAKFGGANQVVKESFQIVIEAPEAAVKKDEQPK